MSSAAAEPLADAPPRALDEALAALLLATGWSALAVASREWLALAPVLVALLAFPALRGRVLANPGPIAWAALALPFALMFRFRQVHGVGGSPFNDAFHGALWALYAGALLLYGPPRPSRHPLVLLLAGVALTAAGAGLPSYASYVAGASEWSARSPLGPWTPSPWAVYLGCATAYAAGALTLLRRAAARGAPTRPTFVPTLALALALLVTLGLTWVGEQLLVRHYEDLNRALLRLARGAPLAAAGGFSDRADLGSVAEVQARGGGAVALRAFAAGAPGYLRGRVFYRYEGGRWEAASGQRAGVEVEDGRVTLPGRPAPSAEAAPELAVHPASRYALHYFTPLHASALATPATRVRVHPGGIVHTGDVPTSRGYDVFLDPAPLRQGGDDPAALALPAAPALIAALDRLLARLDLAPGASAAEAVARLQRHFEGEYEYRFGVTLDPGRDPVAQFLEERRHGHCELFAAAGVLLLRRLGHPSRYVTGFVCAERSPLLDALWLARDRHAHAWIELFDPSDGWRTIELTPSAGVPATPQAAGGEALLEALVGAWDWLAGGFRDDGLSGVPRAVLGLFAALGGWLLGAWWRIGLLGLLLACYVARRWRARAAAAAGAAAQRALPPELAAERERVLALERRLARLGLGRAPSETLLEWAARLERAPAEPWPAGLERAALIARVRAFGHHRYGVPA